MGCNAAVDDGCTEDEVPQHKVYVHAVDIDITEVTNRALAGFLNGVDNACPNGPCVDTSMVELEVYIPFGSWVPEPGRDDHPAIQVSWEAASTYCSWVGKRLPREAEWEKAARGGCELYGASCQQTTPVFPWGNDPASCGLAMMSGPPPGCGLADTAAVGSKPAGVSPYGALDLAGNVWEWVEDWYTADYYCHGDASTCFGICGDCVGKLPWSIPWVQPQGPPAGTHRVVRGGGYFSSSSFVRSAGRAGYQPNVPSKDTGFRCARSDD